MREALNIFILLLCLPCWHVWLLRNHVLHIVISCAGPWQREKSMHIQSRRNRTHQPKLHGHVTESRNKPTATG